MLDALSWGGIPLLDQCWCVRLSALLSPPRTGHGRHSYLAEQYSRKVLRIRDVSHMDSRANRADNKGCTSGIVPTHEFAIAVGQSIFHLPKAEVCWIPVKVLIREIDSNAFVIRPLLQSGFEHSEAR